MPDVQRDEDAGPISAITRSRNNTRKTKDLFFFFLIEEAISRLYHFQVAHKAPWKSPQGKILCERLIANELYYTGHVSTQYSLQTAF